MQLDEKALRKEGFTGGSTLTLADGQDWVFPKPRWRFFPLVSEEGRVDVGGGPSFGPEFDASLDAIFGVIEVEAVETLRIRFEMVVRLLRSNYILSPADLRKLLPMDSGLPGNDEMWSKLDRLIRGLSDEKGEDESPKASADGSGGLSAPTE